MNWNPTHWLASLLISLTGPYAEADPVKPAVVLVHGIFDSGIKMEWLASRFARMGYETYCPSLTPADGSQTLEELSLQLNEKIQERFPTSRRLHIVGFSMGGLVTRHWLANSADLARISSYTTLSTPHYGTFFAYLHNGLGGKEMRPDSEFFTLLESHDNRLAALQPHSIYTPFDLIILPADSSRWKVASSEKIWLPAHPLMVFSPTVSRMLLARFVKMDCL